MGLNDEVGLLFKFRADSSQAIAETGKLRGAIKDEIQGIGQDFAAGAGRVGQFAASLGGTGLAIGAAAGLLIGLGAGLTAVTSKAVELGSRFNDLSIESGLTVETLSGLNAQLVQSGTSAEALGNAVLIMHKNLGAAAEGNRQLKQTFAQLGITDVKAALSDTDGTLRTVIKSLGQMTQESERDRLGTQALGRAYKELRVFISDTGGDIEATLKKAREAGVIMAGEVAGNLDALGDAWDRTSNKALVMSANFVGIVAPEIVKGLDDINSALSTNLQFWEQTALGAAVWAARIRGQLRGAAEWWQGDTWSPQRLGEQMGHGADAAEIGAMTDYYLNKHRPRPPKVPGSDVVPRAGGGKRGGKRSDDGRLKDIQADEKELDADFKRESEALERDYRRRLDTLAQFTEQELSLLDTWIDEKRTIFDREEAEATRSTKKGEERERKLRDIQAKRTAAEDDYQRQRNAAEDKLEEERRQVAEATAEKRLKLAEAHAQSRISTIQRAVEAETKTESEGAAEIGKIQLDLHSKQMGRLQERLDQEREDSAEYQRIKGELGAAEIAHAVLVEEVAHRVAMAKKREVEAEREKLRQLRALRAQAIAERLEVERMEIEVGIAGDRFPTRSERIDNIRARASNDRTAEEQRHKAALEELKNLHDEAVKKATTLDDLFEIEASYHIRRENEARRHSAEMQEIKQQQKRDEDAESPFGGFRDLWESFKTNSKNAGDTIKDSVAEMSSSVVGSLQSMKGALEQGIKANILYGDSIGKAIKKAAAEELAGISARATIKGLEHAAYAIGNLAFGNFGAAAKHAAASAAFFGLAAATGAAASALASSAGMRGNGGSAGGDAVASTGAQAERDRTIREGRWGGAPDPNRPPTVRVVIEDKSRIEEGILRERVVRIIESDGDAERAVAYAWHRDYNRNGITRDNIRREMGEAV